MPIYEYMCNACGHELEALQGISEAPLQDCPNCGQAELRKLISAPVFRLKGGGWYETDFKTSNKRNLAGEGNGASNSSETKASTGKSAEGKSAKGESASSGKPEGSARTSTEA